MSAFFVSHPKETDLALFAGGESGPFARWRIERHVETCPRCERMVADYFHLADQLSVLGDTPDLDWSAMAAGIHARVAMEAPEPQTQRGVPAWTWQLGAAAACAMVAVAVLQIGPKAAQTQAPASKQSSEAYEANDKTLVTENFSVPAPAPTEQDEAAPRRQVTRLEAEAAPRADAPQPEPLLEKKKESLAPVTLAFADRDERLATDALAPPPPAAKAVAMEIAEANGPVANLVAQESRTRETFAAGGRPTAGAPRPAAPAPGSLDSSRTMAGNFGNLQPMGFSAMPLPDSGGDRQVGADGWISVRSINSDGAMTITDVYEPQ